MRSKHLPKVVPWTDHAEWLAVKEDFYAGRYEQAMEQIEVWLERGGCPPAVTSTYSLISLRQRWQVGPERSLRLEASMVLVRLVNETVDPEQRSSYAQSITRLAEGVGLPRLLVDLRHEATHDRLPSLEACELALEAALEWLRGHYWQPWSEWRGWLQERLLSSLLSVEEAGREGEGRNVRRQVGRLLNEVDLLETSLEVMQMTASHLLTLRLTQTAAIIEHLCAQRSALFIYALCQAAMLHPASADADALIQQAAPLLRESWPVKLLLQSAIGQIKSDRQVRVLGLLIAGLRIPVDRRLVALYEAFLQAPSLDPPRPTPVAAEPEAGWHVPEWRPCPLGLAR